MNAPTNGGNSPRIVAIPTSHGSSIRRRASLNTQYATASQKTTPKNSPRLRTTIHVSESKKSRSPPKMLSFCAATRESTGPPGLEEQLPDEVAGGKRDADDREDHNRGKHEDAQPLYERPHGTRSPGRNGDPREGTASR